jgi:hypothetical protein
MIVGFLLKMDEEKKEVEHFIYIYIYIYIYLVLAPHFKPPNLTPTSSSCSTFTLKLVTAMYTQTIKELQHMTCQNRTPSVKVIRKTWDAKT